VLVAVSKGMQAVKLCCNKILQFLIEVPAQNVLWSRVSVCLSLSVAIRPHYCTDPDVTWGVVEAAP